MARIRSVKPELRTSEVVASWPREVRYAFVLLWGYLDDKGRGLDVPKTIAGDCFPHDDDVTPAKMNKWLNLMATTKLDPAKEPPLCRYEVAGRRYLHTVNADEHQRPNRPTPSRLPPCPVHDGLSEPSGEPSGEPPLSDSLSDSVPGIRSSGAGGLGAGEQGSSGAEEPRGEPLGERLNAAAEIIAEKTDATPAEAADLARAIDRDRQPRNLAGLVNALAKGGDLAKWLTEMRDQAGRGDTAAAIAKARRGPACPHGSPGGASLHPVSRKPLCPLCRKATTDG